MKKNMLVLGGTQFLESVLKNSEYTISKKKTAFKLKQKFNLDNFSNLNLTTEYSLNIVKTFTIARSYTYCLLALGEADIKANKPALDYKNDLLSIIDILKNNNITPVLVGLPYKALKSSLGVTYQSIIEDVSIEEDIELINNGISSVTEYSVYSDAEMKRVILRLCM